MTLPNFEKLRKQLKEYRKNRSKLDRKAAARWVAVVDELSVQLRELDAIFTTALGNLAANGLERAGEALADFIGDLPEAAVRSEANARALEQLGAAYGAVQQATNGTVSAQQAAAVQQRALQSGLRLSAQELAAVTARARDFARTTGTVEQQCP